MIKVYRVEHKQNFHGPYAIPSLYWTRELDDLSNILDCLHKNKETHPHVMFDVGLITIWDNARCGFNSLESLKSWFDGCLIELEKCGYVVREFLVELENVEVGQRQIAFNRPKQESRTLLFSEI